MAQSNFKLLTEHLHCVVDQIAFHENQSAANNTRVERQIQEVNRLRVENQGLRNEVTNMRDEVGYLSAPCRCLAIDQGAQVAVLRSEMKKMTKTLTARIHARYGYPIRNIFGR